MQNDKITRWIKIVVMRVLREKYLFHLDVSTLVSAGYFGYSQALQRFDPTRGVKLKTFAEHRIRGAVLDEVRKMIGDERVKHKRPYHVSVECFETLITDNGHQEQDADISIFINNLPLEERDLYILKLRYMGYNLREIAQIIGVSNSRASQLMARIKQTVYQNHGELKFKIKQYICPSCGMENHFSSEVTEFRCDNCDAIVVISNGNPIIAIDSIGDFDANVL
jgi:RNA polymerase sigma factor (sigma-70 family)